MCHFTFKKQIIPVLFVLVLMLPASVFSADETPSREIPETLYIVPFLNVMVAPTLSSKLFDSFIDEMMATGEKHALTIRILKQDIDMVDREWLAKQTFVTGELFDYVEDSGCCSTELSATVRAFLYRPGSIEPVGEFVAPGDAFFNHDLSSLEMEQIRLADRMARNLTAQIYAGLTSAP
jgi:hypothetical protein